WLNVERWRATGIREVLDAGCGDGKNLAMLVRWGFLAIGADLAESGLRKCDEFMQAQKLKGGYRLLPPTPLEQLPLETASVQGAICIDVLGHVLHPERILGELARVARPGALLCASVFHPLDSCRTGPRMRPGDEAGVYWYTPSSPISRM